MIIRTGLLLIYIECYIAYHVTHVSECGKTRGCWLLPNGCRNSSDCSAMITWKHTGRSLLVEMEARLRKKKSGAWLALGVSKDDLMGDDTVLECYFTESEVRPVQLSYNYRDKNMILHEATEILLRDSYAEYRDGRALCGAEWILDTTLLDPAEKKLMHRIPSGLYHLLLAFGDLDKENEKVSHELVGEFSPWRSYERTRFCAHCPSHIVDL